MASEDYSSTSPTKENESPFDADSKASNGGPQGRAMSWQRRPGSQAAERPKSRPLSMMAMAAENAAARSPVGGVSDEADSAAAPSRDQIAHALSSKDPTWFRQTADRGQNSAAYRRSQVEDDTPRMDMSSANAELPGMSRQQQTVTSPSLTEPTEPQPHKGAADLRSPTAALYGKMGSPMSLTPAQRLDPPAGTDTAGDGETSPLNKIPQMSPSLGRTSPTRPISPTKGMGGFVQSAMMKRTDSVKRWSVHSPTGLQRADTVASNRNSVDTARMGAGRSHSRSGSVYHAESNSRPTSGPNSRPTSSHGAKDEPADARPVESAVPQAEGAKPEEDKDKAEPPVSPSKTMDPRRWSPTKSSSWLEAALNKPESPKPKPSPAPSNHNQPTWMAELNKVKTQKGGDATTQGTRAPSATHKHEVKVGGLLRSTPMGTGVKPTPLPGKIHTPSLGTGRLSVSDLRSNLSKPSPSPDDNQRSFGDALEKKTLSSTINTSKPDTPPKKDFRASLKPFQPPPASTAGGNADELKNVFGTLRKTKTQNYVAPDELKDNITRGLAALNVTGGPKPSVRKDEFKDAILQKKAEFQKAKIEGRGVTRNASDAAEKPLPEGLARKLELDRAGSIGARKGSIISEMTAAAEVRPAESSRPADYSRSTSISTPFKPTSPQPGGSPTAVPKPLGGRLADRFNPALAGLLARGPPGASAGGPGSASESSGSQGASGSSGSAEPSAPGPQLTHMTKGRARGPPRKAPSSVAKPAGETIASSTTSQPKPAAASPIEEQPALVAPATATATAAKSPSSVVPPERFSRPKSSYGTSLNESAPPANDGSPTDSPRPKSRSATSPTKNFHEQVAALARGRQGLPEPAPAKQQESTSPVSPHKSLHVRRMSKFFDETATKPEPEPARPLSPSKTGTVRRLPEFEPPKPLSPQKTGGRQLPEPPRSPPKQIQSEQPASGSNTPTLKSRMSGFFAAAAATTAASSAAPTIDARRNTLHSRSRSLAREQIQPLPIPDKESPRSPPAHSPVRSPTKEIASTLNEFFGRSRPTRDYRVDAAEILMHRPEGSGAAKIKTLSAQLFRVGGDGKKQPVPTHQDRVLFEAEMYLCVHSFADADSGRQDTEVYFWAGDEVAPSAVEDAQLFAGREARAVGGRLVQLAQGKETAEFLQALGGIVTVRRGSGTKYDQLAPSMLCGRRHLGQVTFDEVDFSPHSLCSGFVYLVTKNGQCHMWKGKGSDVEELGCARLVGMELSLMGELVEVDDGAETDEFWSLFGSGPAAAAASDGTARAVSADHWRLKPNYPKYSARLFRSDAGDRQQVSEPESEVPGAKVLSLSFL